MRQRLTVAVVLALTAATSVAADTVPTQVLATPSTSTQGQAAERTAAERWRITVEEYRRAQDLLQGVPASLADPHISPIEVLGIFARSDAERARYAELFARASFDYMARVLQFDAAYQQAAHRLYPDSKVVATPPKAIDHATPGAKR